MNAAEIKAVVATMVDRFDVSQMRSGKLGVVVGDRRKTIDVKDCGFSESFLRSIVARQLNETTGWKKV
jgi:hypothetical protein